MQAYFGDHRDIIRRCYAGLLFEDTILRFQREWAEDEGIMPVPSKEDLLPGPFEVALAVLLYVAFLGAVVWAFRQ